MITAARKPAGESGGNVMRECGPIGARESWAVCESGDRLSRGNGRRSPFSRSIVGALDAQLPACSDMLKCPGPCVRVGKLLRGCRPRSSIDASDGRYELSRVG